MSDRYDVTFDRALALTLERLHPLAPVSRPVWKACDLVLAEDAVAAVDSPSLNASTKDGYAVRSDDVAGATPDQPVSLALAGVTVAGGAAGPCVEPGTAVHVMTGAALPDGADAVLAVEFTRSGDESVLALRDAGPGRNVLRRGSDVTVGQTVVAAGSPLAPAMTGLLAASGLERVPVHPRPCVGVVATGDEVVAPGRPLRPGQLYASNLVTLQAWLNRFRMNCRSTLVADDPDRLRVVLEEVLADSDVVLTSGGAWKSERDFTAQVLETMGFEIVYHRVKLGPGKAVALAVRDDRAVFCLPGGPPSNEMAFLQLALPGLLRLAGRSPEPFRRTTARLTGAVPRRWSADLTWTQFFQARLSTDDDGLVAEPLRWRSRLRCQASADALVELPAGTEQLGPDDPARVQILHQPGLHVP